MSPVQHARLSVRDFGGEIKDYLRIHEFIDSTKNHLADSRHRVILHNSFGMELCTILFDSYIINSDNKYIDVREIARRHILLVISQYYMTDISKLSIVTPKQSSAFLLTKLS